MSNLDFKKHWDKFSELERIRINQFNSHLGTISFMGLIFATQILILALLVKTLVISLLFLILALFLGIIVFVMFENINKKFEKQLKKIINSRRKKKRRRK